MSLSNQNQEKILTLNLGGKKGVNILKSKYDVVKDSIVSFLQKNKTLTMSELSKLVSDDISSTFEGKIGWYFMAVKLDLEARGEIERIPNKTPQTLQLK
jgi:hypothetical protein